MPRRDDDRIVTCLEDEHANDEAERGDEDAGKNAVQNPDTLNPGTADETISIISALITSRKKPKVTTVSGMVRKMMIGRMNALARPSRSAAMLSAPLLANLMPWKMKLATQSDSAVIPRCIKKRNMSFVILCQRE